MTLIFQKKIAVKYTLKNLLVKSDAPVAMNKNSDPVHNFFPTGGWGG